MDIPVETKNRIIDQELQMARNTLYLIEVRIRVAKKIGNDTKPAEEEMAKTIRMVDELEIIKAELIKAGNNGSAKLEQIQHA